MFNPEAIREANRQPITVEELARRELMDEARFGYFAEYSNVLLRELYLPLDKMSKRAYGILKKRIEMLEKSAGEDE